MARRPSGLRQRRSYDVRALAASDVISILEGFYACEAPDNEWADGILQRIEHGLGMGGGAGILQYDASHDDRIVVTSLDARNTPDGWVEAGLDMTQDPARRADYLRYYRSDMVWSVTTSIAEVSWREAMRTSMENAGYADILAINGSSPAAIGCCLFVFADKTIRLTPQRVSELSRIASHLSTAHRLRRKVAATRAAGTDGVEAILSARGHLEYANTNAASRLGRESLKSAMEAREWARGRARRDEPQRALGAWKGLVAARWSLVDRFENDGKRYVLARENTLGADGPRVLTERENAVVALAATGRSNKVIAYELGIAHATVRVLIARASAKLKARTREELVEQHRRDAVGQVHEPSAAPKAH